LTKENKNKNRRQLFFASDEPENHTRKEKDKSGNSEERERGRRKKIMAALLAFMLSSLKTEFETEKLFDGRDLFGCKVTL